MIERTWDRLKEHIPPDQAAYQPGRGTTEQVFAIKLLAEKAIISNDYQINLLLLDITNRPKIQVKVRNTIGDTFETLIGIMQGDVLSAIMFIFYLAKCLRRTDQNKEDRISVETEICRRYNICRDIERAR